MKSTVTSALTQENADDRSFFRISLMIAKTGQNHITAKNLVELVA
jgi:hypothetical protein